MATSFAELPSVALQTVLRLLSSCTDDVNAARLACKALAEVSYSALTSATPKHASLLESLCSKFPGLYEVDLKYVKLADDQVLSLTQLKHLQKLSLYSHDCNGSAARQLFGALGSCLTRLEVGAVSDELAAQLASLQQLQSLAVSGRLSDAGLIRGLAGMMQLRFLSLSCCDTISADGLQALTSLSNLHTLQLHSCLQLDNAALHVLGQLTQLTYLSLSHSCEEASSSGLLALSQLKHLQQLNLSATSEAAPPAALVQLLSGRPLLKLTHLDVSYCESVNAEVLRAIATSLSGLRVLGLSGISPRALQSVRYLKHLAQLEQLQLRWVGQLKDAHITSFLPHLAALTALDLSYCRSLTCDGLQVLQWMTQLRQLNLLAVANDDLGWLAALKQLTGLTVSLFPATSSAWQHVARLTALQALALRRCQLTGQAASSTTSNCSTGSTSCSSSSSSTKCNSSSSFSNQLHDATCLQQLQGLVALDCSGSSVSATGLSVLQQLPRLQQLGLSRCQGVTNTVLAALAGCSSLHKLDLRLRGTASTWNSKGLMGLLCKSLALNSVYVTEVPAGLPSDDCRVLACTSEQVPLPVARDVGYGAAVVSLF